MAVNAVREAAARRGSERTDGETQREEEEAWEEEESGSCGAANGQQGKSACKCAYLLRLLEDKYSLNKIAQTGYYYQRCYE